jgi:hypothetical protein
VALLFCAALPHFCIVFLPKHKNRVLSNRNLQRMVYLAQQEIPVLPCGLVQVGNLKSESPWTWNMTSSRRYPVELYGGVRVPEVFETCTARSGI